MLKPFLLHQIGSSGIVVFAIIRVISTLLADPDHEVPCCTNVVTISGNWILSSFCCCDRVLHLSTPFGQKLLHEVKLLNVFLVG